MLEIRRILCPTDLSDIAPRTLENALALARFHRAEVELLYVSEPLLPGPASPVSYPPWSVLDPAVRGRLGDGARGPDRRRRAAARCP